MLVLQDRQASRAAYAVKREKQREGVLSCTLPLGQKTSLPLTQQNTTDLLFNSKLSSQIKRGKEKLFFLPFTLRKKMFTRTEEEGNSLYAHC